MTDKIMTKTKGLFKAYIFALIAITAWGFSFVWEDFLIKNNIEIFTFIFERMIVAALILWAVGGALGKIQKIRKGDMKYMFLLAFGEPFIYFLGENFGIKYTSGVMAAIIIATIPLFCTVVDRFLYKFRLTLQKVLGCLLSLIGIALFMMEKAGAGSSQLKGILLLLFFAVGGSLIYSYITKKMISSYNALTIVTYQFSFGAVLFLPLFLLFGLKGLTPEFFSVSVQSKVFALAIICSCICFGLWAYCTGKLGVTRVSIFSALIPLVSAAASYFLYPGQESFTLLKVVGILLTIAGVITVQVVKDVRVAAIAAALLLTISCRQGKSYKDSAPMVEEAEFADLNFDGYEDLFQRQEDGVCFLYDPKAEKYVECPSFSDIAFKASVSVYPEQKYLVTMHYAPHTSETAFFMYVFEGGKFLSKGNITEHEGKWKEYDGSGNLVHEADLPEGLSPVWSDYINLTMAQ